MIRFRNAIISFAAALVAGSALAGTATFSLSSPSAGQTVAPGDPIQWQITVEVSIGDNLGLALASVDLNQSAGNPATFDLPAADAAPVALVGFDRPAGITNPSPDGISSGFSGTPIGTAGAKNLVQIGGAQNTFGEPGASFGIDVDVDQGIGQGGPQVLATGSFPAPSTPGDYTIELANAIANVLTDVNVPPAYSPVAAADIAYGAQSFTFSVSAVNCPGDLNGDLNVGLADLGVMFGCWQQACGDITGDNNTDLSDLGLLFSNWNLNCN